MDFQDLLCMKPEFLAVCGFSTDFGSIAGFSRICLVGVSFSKEERQTELRCQKGSDSTPDRLQNCFLGRVASCVKFSSTSKVCFSQEDH